MARRAGDDPLHHWGWPDEDEFEYEEDIPESGRDWRRAKGIFVLAPVGGPAGERIAEIQQQYDPKLAVTNRPHVTMVGSSGTGPITPGTDVQTLRASLQPVVAALEPMVLHFGAPTRFMQTNIVSLPLDPNGPLRLVHERIKATKLDFMHARFAFTPHATLHFYPVLTRARARELLALRVDEPAIIDRLELSLTNDPQPPRHLFTLMLGREAAE